MRSMIAGIALLAAVCLCWTAAWADDEAVVPLSNPDYLVGPGDVLEVSVWKEEALSRLVTVLPDGKFSFPLIGEITGAGKTVEQLRDEFSRRIAEFAPDPVVVFSVQQVNSMHVYVVGRVQRPGRFVLNANIDALQALAMAGGLSTFAEKKKIRIFRKNGGERVAFDFNYDEVVKGENLEQNIELIRGDVIVVP